MVKFVFKLCIVFFHIKAFAISLYGYIIINGYFHPTQLAFSICCFLRSSLEGWELDLATTFFLLFLFFGMVPCNYLHACQLSKCSSPSSFLFVQKIIKVLEPSAKDCNLPHENDDTIQNLKEKKNILPP